MGDFSNIDIGWRSALMFAVCLPMIVVAAMLATRRVERAANSFLAGFLLIAAIAQIPQILGFAGFYQVWPGLTFAPFNVELYAGPLLYLHADRLMKDRPLGWRKWLLLPGCVQTTYYTWAFLSLGDYKAKWAYDEAVHTPFIKPVETVIGVALMVFAVVAIFRMVASYRRFLNNTQSAARDFDPSWLSRLMVVIALAAIVFSLLLFIPLLIQPISYVDAFPAEVVMTCLLAWLGFEALVRTSMPFPKMCSGEPEALVNMKSETTGRDWLSEGQAVRSAVLAGGWYLEPRLSIRDLAQRMASNETYISRALNQGLGLSFNAFVNGLRVEYAQTLLRDGGRSVVDIALASGFNSKATFNRVFRDIAGQTPSQHRTSQNP